MVISVKNYFQACSVGLLLCGLSSSVHADVQVFEFPLPEPVSLAWWQPKTLTPIVVAVLSPPKAEWIIPKEEPVYRLPQEALPQDPVIQNETSEPSEFSGNVPYESENEKILSEELIAPNEEEKTVEAPVIIEGTPPAQEVIVPPSVEEPIPLELPPVEQAVVDPKKLGPGGLVSVALVAPLMEWIERETGTKVPVLPQVIADRSRFEAVLRRMGRNFEGRPQSAYMPGIVFLDDLRWDPDEPTQVSLLVHELVHHAQLYMKNIWACSNAREEQAYSLQNRWLEQQGHSPFVNVSWIQRVSSCPDLGAGTYLAQTSRD